jgi:hypothetical protein
MHAPLPRLRNSSPTGRLVALVILTAWCAGAQMPRLNLLKNSGFEKGDGNKLANWLIRDHMSTWTREKAHGGTHSLKITDATEKQGSAVYSRRFKVIPRRKYYLRAWVYLESGPKNGLGLYLKFRDAEGKEIFDPGGKQQIARFTMAPGRWVPVFFRGHVPPKAKTVEICIHTYNAVIVTCYVDDVELFECFGNAWGDAENWEGGIPDEWFPHGDEISVRWAHRASSSLTKAFTPPADWSEHSGISFWLHANKATGNAFMLTILSENPRTKGPDYWSVRIPVDWKGWRQFAYSFKELRKSREPIGWNHIDKIRFAAAGWGNTPNPELVIHLAGFHFVDVLE